VYRACPKCTADLDPAVGEWVADFPDRPIHGYRISQLFSTKVDPAEILEEYRTTRFLDRFYNLKIGIPWADVSRRLDAASVLSLCTEEDMEEMEDQPGWGWCTMGVDTGRELHVVILRATADRSGPEPWRLIHLEVCHDFEELRALMKRFWVNVCVIDGLPETHATRQFARQYYRQVFMSFFNDHQRGETQWDEEALSVTCNRTEALDASRAAVRDRKIILPRRSPKIDEFAQHMAADAKVLEEDEETGTQRFRYVRTGTNHFSMAFTYAWLAASIAPRPFRIEDCLVLECDSRILTEPW
ncbi:MAG: phage terminase large subunit family protein, partial [Candidatus Eisenbacteria bacterium]|nr:phage terminase large subunit family protein [Candidatus Eisenbacteria bacterium]